jgi:hypothetical protein
MLPGSLAFVRMRQGQRPTRVPTLADAIAHDWTPAELAWVAERNSQQAIGDIGHVKRRIDDILVGTHADEVIIVPQGPDLATKVRTLEEVALLPA